MAFLFLEVGFMDDFLLHHVRGRYRVRYWDYVPTLFQWPVTHDRAECPLRFTYQLARNILAASVRAEPGEKPGNASPTSGHAVLLYDARNPAFRDGGKGDRAFRDVSNSLKDPRSLRRCSWQTLAGVLARYPELEWLVDGLARKYGIEAGGA